jgi:chromosome condensin MukBEF MukE localization factor
MFESYLGQKNEANSIIVKRLCFLYLMRYRLSKRGTTRKYPLRSKVLESNNNVALQRVMVGRFNPGETP